MTQSQHSHRKDEHVFLAEKFFKANAEADFSRIRFIHSALPETDLNAIDLSKHAPFGWTYPLYINAMTGGSAQTGEINRDLGRLAATLDLAIASGSQSVGLSDPTLRETFTALRADDQSGFVIANIGANHGVAAAQAAIAMLDANALEIHLNVAQELIMPEGDRNFHWRETIASIVKAVKVPVIVKEVGFGMQREDIKTLISLGVQYVDIGGRGGTNFAQIENVRRAKKDFDYLTNWGQTTVESLLEAQALPVTILATGGIRTPLDALIALRLGASAVGISGLVLHHLVQNGYEEALAFMTEFLVQLKQLFALVGAADVAALRTRPILLDPILTHYQNSRDLPDPNQDRKPLGR